MNNGMFPHGILEQELFMGIVSSIASGFVRVNLNNAGSPSGYHFTGDRYGKGEVGEFVLIEGQLSILLGRLITVKLPEVDRKNVVPQYSNQAIDAFGDIQLLGSISIHNLHLVSGVDYYPRIGDRVYAAPALLISCIPALMEKSDGTEDSPIRIKLGCISTGNDNSSARISIRPEKIFGRHCAILGTTGGGKSWTTSRIIEACLEYQPKMILIDATGEYRNFRDDEKIAHVHLGSLPTDLIMAESKNCSLPSTAFTEADFTSLFQPSPGIQAPKLREALVSLRVVNKRPDLGDSGVLLKSNRPYSDINSILEDPEVASVAYDPTAPIDCTKLVRQIECECVWENETGYGRKNDQQWGYCSTLVARISSIMHSQNLRFVFQGSGLPSIYDEISGFIGNDQLSLLRICLAGVSYEYNSREVIGNTLGRILLNSGRNGLLNKPLILFVDEAHNFIGKKLGIDENATRLDAFEMIAKEGRKYGLSLCLATQRPRDITEDVLSQIGTLIVHRLTNDRDREVVEKACGEIDKSASSFLPNLKPGEAAIIGSDFPIPLTIQFDEPRIRPLSDGPNYQDSWRS